MRVLHTSDWHLGISLHGVSLLWEQEQVLNHLAKTVEEQEVDAVIIAGDVFDHAIPVPEALRLYSDTVSRLCLHLRVPVLICAGNHDGAARLAMCAPLLRGAGLYVAGRLSDGVEPVELGDACFFILPWFPVDEARYLYPEKDIRTTAQAMSVVCEGLRERLCPDKRNILISHCFAAGGEPGDSDRAAVLGTAGRVDPEAFAGFDYVALGHLHRTQQFTASTGTLLRYSGTPYPYSFGEAVQEKTFTLLDTQSMGITEIPIPLPRPLRVLRGTFAELLEKAPWDSNKEDYLKVELTDGMGMDRMALLREYYPNLLALEGLTPSGAVEGGLTVGELEALTPLDLATRFCEDVGGFTPEQDLLDLFLSAAEGVE